MDESSKLAREGATILAAASILAAGQGLTLTAASTAELLGGFGFANKNSRFRLAMPAFGSLEIVELCGA